MECSGVANNRGPAHLGKGGYPQAFPQLGFQRLRPTQLANSRHHAVEVPEDQHRPLSTVGPPPRDRFQISKHIIESLPEIGEDVISILTRAMARVDRRRGAAHENCSRNHSLEMTFRREQLLPITRAGAGIGHVPSLSRIASRCNCASDARLDARLEGFD
jgi:hypothetical protein